MRPVVALFVFLVPTHVLAIINDAALETRRQCEARFEKRLATDSLSGRRSTNQSHGTVGFRDLVDLSGYAVHQPLRSAPFDVYITMMRIRVPEHSRWFQLEDCSFESGRRALSARLLLRNILVSGHIKMVPGGSGASVGAERTSGVTYGRIGMGVNSDSSCAMILRLRRAELGLYASETGVSLPLLLPLSAPTPHVRTDAHFVEPEMASLSVHAYGCHLKEPGEPLALEVEDIFLRGMQTVVAKTTQRRLEPALRDALLLHLGYSPSYGRK